MHVPCTVSPRVAAQIHEATEFPALAFHFESWLWSHERSQHKTDNVNYLFSSNNLAGKKKESWKMEVTKENFVKWYAGEILYYWYETVRLRCRDFYSLVFLINPLKPELSPICCLLALLGAHNFLHFSRIRVKLLTFRLLMS